MGLNGWLRPDGQEIVSQKQYTGAAEETRGLTCSPRKVEARVGMTLRCYSRMWKGKANAVTTLLCEVRHTLTLLREDRHRRALFLLEG